MSESIIKQLRISSDESIILSLLQLIHQDDVNDFARISVDNDQISFKWKRQLENIVIKFKCKKTNKNWKYDYCYISNNKCIKEIKNQQLNTEDLISAVTELSSDIGKTKVIYPLDDRYTYTVRSSGFNKSSYVIIKHNTHNGKVVAKATLFSFVNCHTCNEILFDRVVDDDIRLHIFKWSKRINKKYNIPNYQCADIINDVHMNQLVDNYNYPVEPYD